LNEEIQNDLSDQEKDEIKPHDSIEREARETEVIREYFNHKEFFYNSIGVTKCLYYDKFSIRFTKCLIYITLLPFFMYFGMWIFCDFLMSKGAGFKTFVDY